MKRAVVMFALAVAAWSWTVAAQETKEAKGTVTAVAADKLTVKAAAAKDNAEEWTFVVDQDTRVVGSGASTKTKEKAAAGDKTVITDFVGMGDAVTVRYREQGKEMRAREVRVTRKAPK